MILSHYEVISFFTDMQDNDYPYNIGDVFPREGKSFSEDRYKSLSSDENRQFKPLIKRIEDSIISNSDEDIKDAGVEESKETKTPAPKTRKKKNVKNDK